MVVFIEWEKVESTCFGTMFEKACFEELGYTGYAFPTPSKNGCTWHCGSYDRNFDAGLIAVFDRVVNNI